MNRKTLEKYINIKTEIKLKDIHNTLNCFFEIVTDALKKNEKINLSGFGKFFLKKRNKRYYTNLQTGEKFLVPTRKVPQFKFSTKIIEKF